MIKYRIIDSVEGGGLNRAIGTFLAESLDFTFFCGILVSFSATKVAGNCWLFYAKFCWKILVFFRPDWALFSSAVRQLFNLISGFARHECIKHPIFLEFTMISTLILLAAQVFAIDAFVPGEPNPNTLTCTTKICATNGIVYKNLRELKLAYATPAPRNRIRVEKVGSGLKCAAYGVACTREYNPQCGLYGDFYANPCLMSAARDFSSPKFVYVRNVGCIKKCDVGKTVCDQFGNKYDNKCKMPGCSVITSCKKY